MPNEHLTPDQLRGYFDRTSSAGELLATSDHLAHCSHCRGMLLQSLGDRNPQPVEEDISYEQLVSLLDGARCDPLAARETAASPRASAELADLAAFAEAMNALPARDYDLEQLAEGSATRALQNWLLPLAAAVALGVGALWWTITLRQATGAAAKLTDAGKEIEIGADGRAPALRDLPAPLQASVAEALRTRRLEIPPDVAALQGNTGTLAGARDRAPALRLLAPVATAVADGKPRFRWSAQPGATAYRVNVVREKSGALLPSDELASSQTEWTPNESLSPGETYEWEVQALRDNKVIAKSPAPPQPEARFRVLTPAEVAELKAVKAAAAGSHLSLGVGDARAGLLDDAAAEFRELAVENPRSELVRQLLEQLDSKRRQ